MTREEVLYYAGLVGLTEAKVNAMTVPQKIDLLASVGRAKLADANTVAANSMSRFHTAQLQAANILPNGGNTTQVAANQVDGSDLKTAG